MDIGTTRDTTNKHVKKRREIKKALKVVYISSPMKVKTSVSKFRALVQELTGRESDVARLMEMNGVLCDDGFKHVDYYHQSSDRVAGNHQTVQAALLESPTSSVSGPGSVFETFDDLFVPEMFDESCTGLLFPSGFLNESFKEADFVRNFDLV